MKCFNCGGMQMLRSKHTGGIYWLCPRCNSTTESTSNSENKPIDYNFPKTEEHYMNVIYSQHKLVDESKKEEFKKCMKCTDNTYQYGFKDGYNKANEWHFVKDGDLPKENQLVLLYRENPNGANVALTHWYKSYVNDKVIAWKEIVPPKEI